MGMLRYEHGDVMDLNWEYGVEALYIRGHVDPGDAHSTLLGYYGDTYQWETPRAKWGRWSCEGAGCDGQTLREYDSSGRGRFPIMAAKVVRRPG